MNRSALVAIEPCRAAWPALSGHAGSVTNFRRGAWHGPRLRGHVFSTRLPTLQLVVVLCLPLNPGAVAQLGERLVCNQKVAGSIPVGSNVVSLAERMN